MMTILIILWNHNFSWILGIINRAQLVINIAPKQMYQILAAMYTIGNKQVIRLWQISFIIITKGYEYHSVTVSIGDSYMRG